MSVCVSPCVRGLVLAQERVPVCVFMYGRV